jgi:hypothetical protein
MKSNEERETIKKRLIITIVVAVAAIALAVVTIVALKSVAPQVGSPSVQKTASLKAGEVVSAYSTAGTIKALNETTYSQQINSESESRVLYKSDGHSYITSIPTKDHLLFYAKNKLEKNDSSEVQAQTTAFMEARGLSKQDLKVSAANTPKYITYKNDTTVCQLSSSGIDAQLASPAYHELSCVSGTDIQSEYAVIDKLLNLYKSSHQLAEFSQATRVTTSEGNKSLSIISFVGIESHPALLFAAVDSNWSYVGDIGSGTVSNGKYALTPDLKSAIADPKYGGFLQKNIGN